MIQQMKPEALAEQDLDQMTGGKALREGLWINRATRLAEKGGSAVPTEQISLGYTKVEWTY